MEYNILTSVAAGAVDTGKLSGEISNSGFVAGFTGISVSGNRLIVSGQVTNQAGLTALINAHDPMPLVDYKKVKNWAIDLKTQALIALGFTFATKGFSLSAAAQMNWSALKTFELQMTWPVKITSNGDVEYTLALLDMPAFTGTAVSTVSGHYTSGRGLKGQVNAAISKAAVDAVVDTR